MNDKKPTMNGDHKNSIGLKEEGVILKDRGNLDEAISCFQKAIQQDPRDVEAFFHLGHCYMSKAEHFRATRCFQQALQLDPNNVNSNRLG